MNAGMKELKRVCCGCRLMSKDSYGSGRCLAELTPVLSNDMNCLSVGDLVTIVDIGLVDRTFIGPVRIYKCIAPNGYIGWAYAGCFENV